MAPQIEEEKKGDDQQEAKKNKKKKNKKKKEVEEPIDDMDFLKSIIADKYTCPTSGCEASIKMGWC